MITDTSKDISYGKRKTIIFACPFYLQYTPSAVSRTFPSDSPVWEAPFLVTGVGASPQVSPCSPPLSATVLLTSFLISHPWAASVLFQSRFCSLSEVFSHWLATARIGSVFSRFQHNGSAFVLSRIRVLFLF